MPKTNTKLKLRRQKDKIIREKKNKIYVYETLKHTHTMKETKRARETWVKEHTECSHQKYFKEENNGKI